MVGGVSGCQLDNSMSDKDGKKGKKFEHHLSQMEQVGDEAVARTNRRSEHPKITNEID